MTMRRATIADHTCFGAVATSSGSGTRTFTIQNTGTAALTLNGASPYVSISGVAASDFSITTAPAGTVAAGNTGYYRVVVGNSFGSATSAAAYLSVTPAYSPAIPDGYASAATGGGSTSPVVVLTAADFKAQATSPSASTITVVGTLNIGTVNVAANKTIQGADASAALLGNLNLNGVSNVIIRGLNLTNPGTVIVSGAYTNGGDALTISGSSKVFVTHCTFFDCADHEIKIVSGSDNVTVAWCEFYASSAALLHRYSVQIGAAAESQPLHVTLHHNWWSSNLDQRMPISSYGYVHLYNNYLVSTGNTAGSLSGDHAQFLCERSVYNNVTSPLAKYTVSASITGFVPGRIRAIGNVYNSCTGSAPDAGADDVFTPAYSYELLPASDVATEVSAKAGNIAGAGYVDAATSTASITGPIAAVAPGTTFTLTAVSSGFTASTYQWRLNNVDIAGANSATYTNPNIQEGDAGVYTVAISLTSGDTVVSTPLAITLGAEIDRPKVSAGGSFDAWFCVALALLGSACSLRRRLR